MKLVCNYRDQVRARPNASKQPKVVTKTVVRPPSDEEIQRALKVYLRRQFAF